MSIVLRYVDIERDFEYADVIILILRGMLRVREAFAGFIELNAGTGQSLADTILQFIAVSEEHDFERECARYILEMRPWVGGNGRPGVRWSCRNGRL